MKPKLNGTEWLLMAIEPAAADDEIITHDNGLKEPTPECGFIILYDDNAEATDVAREAAISLMKAWAGKAYLTDMSDLSSYGDEYTHLLYSTQIKEVARLLNEWANMIAREEVNYRDEMAEYEEFLALKKRFEPEEGK